jgi:hypothetical protein
MKTTFVFLQVGNAIEPTILVKSLRNVMPSSRIIQCSDKGTDKIDGVTEIFYVDGDINNLMTLRLKAFSELALEEIAVYVDTDMIFLRPFDPILILETADAAVCERSFSREKLFNRNFEGGGFDWSVYKNKTIYEVHPYIACFTITKNYNFWAEAYARLMKMPSMFHYWFGDQEAIKSLVQASSFQIKKIPEATYACLPEEPSPEPVALHFKGFRKSLMMQSKLLKSDESRGREI